MTYVARFTPSGAVDVATQPAVQALTANLVIPPGVYSYNGTAYVCTTEGLYRWLNPNTDTTNRIVYQSDPYALLSGLAWLCTHGRTDEALTVAQKTSQAKTSKLRMRCGKTIEWVRSITDGLGLTTRTVQWLTMQDGTGQPWSGVDEGHVAMEAKIGGQWCYFDPDNSLYVRRADGTHPSARDVVPILAEDSAVLVPLSNDAKSSAEPFASGQWDTTGWVEMTLIRDGEDGTRKWVRRICQAVGIPNGSEVWWKLPPGSEGRAAWVEGLSSTYKVKDAATWDATFYP